MANFTTEQEAFWAGEFGNEYSQRNVGEGWLAANAALFSQILRRTRRVGSVLEFGANIGLNLRSIRTLLPNCELSAIEINPNAATALRAWGAANVYEGTILEFCPTRTWDFTLIKGVLIHINPDELNLVYDNLYNSSSKYICVVEYYNPTPVALPYRGHEEKLFKRDFAGEILSRFPGLELVDYGFCYHRDVNFPQDDVTWFLLEKT